MSTFRGTKRAVDGAVFDAGGGGVFSKRAAARW